MVISLAGDLHQQDHPWRLGSRHREAEDGRQDPGRERDQHQECQSPGGRHVAPPALRDHQADGPARPPAGRVRGDHRQQAGGREAGDDREGRSERPTRQPTGPERRGSLLCQSQP